MKKYTVTEPARIEEIAQTCYPGITETEIKQLLRHGYAKLDGHIVKKDCEAKDGQTVEFYGEFVMPRFLPKTEVVYEDDNMIVFNKQQGIPTIRQQGETSLLDIAEKYMREQGSYSVEARCVPIVCNGMDKETGGLVLVAKNEQFYEEAIAALRQRRIRKFYRCMVKGVPSEPRGEFHDFMVQDIKNDRVKVSGSMGKDSVPAVTRYERIHGDRFMSLLEVEPVTGRLRQISAQLAYHGIPIAGDEHYGDKKFNKKAAIYYEALWLYKLVFEVGRNNLLEYLNDKVIQTQDFVFPYAGFER